MKESTFRVASFFLFPHIQIQNQTIVTISKYELHYYKNNIDKLLEGSSPRTKTKYLDM